MSLSVSAGSNDKQLLAPTICRYQSSDFTQSLLD